MADEFTLTNNPVRTSTTGKQRLDQALDVSGYDFADLLLGVLTLEGPTPSVTIRVLTSMQTETEDGWVVATTFTQVTASNNYEMKTDVKFLKFIRWEVSQISGSTTVTFTLRGMLRNHG